MPLGCIPSIEERNSPSEVASLISSALFTFSPFIVEIMVPFLIPRSFNFPSPILVTFVPESIEYFSFSCEVRGISLEPKTASSVFSRTTVVVPSTFLSSTEAVFSLAFLK